jgi:O-antigen/teichoic acid export membrane protein
LKRKFLKNLILLIILNLLIKPFWVFGIDRSVQNLVGSSEYGFYFSLFGFSLLFNILLDLGITNFNNRSISQDSSLLRKYLSNIIVIKFLLAILYVLISFTIAIALGYEKRQLNLLFILIANQFLSSFLLYLRSNISGLQYYTTDSLLSVLDKGLMIILCSLLLWGNAAHQPISIEWFVYMQTVSYMLAIIAVGLVLYLKSGHLSFSLSRELMFQIIKQTIPYAILGLLISIYNRTDSVLLERLLPDGLTQTGIYAQSFRILDAFSNFALLFAFLLLPMFAKQLATNEDILPLLKTSFSLLFLMCTAISLSCAAFSKPIMQALYHEDHEYSSIVFAILILSFVPISLNYIFGTLLTANGSLKYLNYAALGAVVLNITLNLVLIPFFKAPGAAVASLTTQWLITIAQIIISFKIWKLKTHKADILKYSIFILSSIAIVLFLSEFSGAWLLRFILSIGSVCTIGLITGILPVKQFIDAIKLQLKGMAS